MYNLYRNTSFILVLYLFASDTISHDLGLVDTIAVVTPIINCPTDITVNNDPGQCGAEVQFPAATATDPTFVAESTTLRFEGPTVYDPVYIESDMRMVGDFSSHIDAPWEVICGTGKGARIHSNTSNTWEYRGGTAFTPVSVFVCDLNSTFYTGQCDSTSFTPTTTGLVTFPNTPEWQGITSMTWSNESNDDADMDDFTFQTALVYQSGGLESGCFFPVGTTTVTYTATNNNGESTTCSFDINVIDVELPLISCDDVGLQLDPNGELTLDPENLNNVIVSDNCDIDTYELSQTVFSCSDIDTTTSVSLTVVDTNGNQNSCSFMVTIESGNFNSNGEPIEDVIACGFFELPEIVASTADGTQGFYTQTRAQGRRYEVGEILQYEDFTSYPITLYAASSSVPDACFYEDLFEIVIHPLPTIELVDSYQLCASSLPEATLVPDTSSQNLDYQWSIRVNNTFEPLDGAVQPELITSVAGIYQLTVTNPDSGCSQSTTTTVFASPVPVAFSTLSDNSTMLDRHTIRIEVEDEQSAGAYQVRLDNGFWQDLSYDGGVWHTTLRNVATGNGTAVLSLRSSDRCWQEQLSVPLISIPQFFTPNSDGYHDFWNIRGAADMLQGVAIGIYNRQGTLIKQIQANGIGWDGTYLGTPIPSNDYWYRMTIDGNSYTGHFTLKR